MNDRPEFSEAGIAAVKLLQGVIYEEDADTWGNLLSNESELETWFYKVGMVVVIDRSNGMAFLRQLSDDERTEGYERLPRMFVRSPLSYDATLGCVLLRDEFRKFEDEDLDNERCVVDAETLFDRWKSFFPAKEDEVSLRKKLVKSLNQLEKHKLIRKLKTDTDHWEVRRAIKARVPIDQLEQLKERLAEHAK
jgi:hypothetical protein